jgi:hypothetical protein
MSEKRRHKQQRRQRRKAKGASRAQARVDRVFGQVARLALASVSDITTALEAEQWASSLLDEWRGRELADEETDAALFPSLVDAFEAIGTAPTLASLRALTAVATERGAVHARAAADRLAASGLPEPEWAATLGQARPTGAALLEEPVFDDGVSVVIEFDVSYALDVYIDHNLGGLVSDVSVTGPLSDVRQNEHLMFREIGLADARARVEAALETLQRSPEPPVDEQVWALRAMIAARLRLLPDGFEPPDEHVSVDREALLADFFAAPEGERWRGDQDAEFVIRHAVDFGADVNHGGPLRWSPGTVAVFLTGWVPDRVMAEPEFFARVPDVLRDWVRYAGRRRGVPAEALRDAVEAVGDYREDLLNAVTDPDTWSLAEAIAESALEAGIDPSDDAALARFMREQAE